MKMLTKETINQQPKHSSSFTTFGFDYFPSHCQTLAIAQDILTDLMRFRRASDPLTACTTSHCQECFGPHLSKLISAISQRQPITFVLPAFPGKSPNPAKVLGPLPDMAEKRALEFLQHLCNHIKLHYPPGAKIILCSDGRVFSDIVGMRDGDVTAYQNELSKIIVELSLSSISTFNLEELHEGLTFDQMREQLMKSHGEPLDVLKESVSRGGKSRDCSVDDKEMNRLYCGITRFLLEDAMFPGQKRSRTSIQKESRAKAYEVIQRSKAWGELIAAKFPDAVRLSIHPQSCGAKKLGIRLSDSTLRPDNWQTPWHGVAMDLGGRFVLIKRSQAEILGARLIYQMGRPSHYVLTDKNALSQFQRATHGP